MSEIFEYEITEKGAIITKLVQCVYKVEVPEEIEGVPVVGIGRHAFAQHQGTLLEITLPDSLETIGEYAFAGCSRLLSVSLPEGLTSIERYAFSDCSSLIEVHLPDSVHTIGDAVFWRCIRLRKANIPNGIEELRREMFYQCSNLCEVVLPEGLQSIGQFAFNQCEILSEIILPESLRVIDMAAFLGCARLADITFPEGLRYLGGSAFRRCESLTKVSLPKSLTHIGPNVFDSCEALVEIEQDGETLAVQCIDGYCTETLRTRKLGEAEVSQVRIFGDERPLWVAKILEYYAHGETSREAVEDCQFKVRQGELDLEEEILRIRQEDKVTVEDYRLLTGACREGCRRFLESTGVTRKSLSVHEAIELVQGQYGAERFIELLRE